MALTQNTKLGNLANVNEGASGLHSPAEREPLALLGGRELTANRGIPLNLDWIENIRVNTSAVERRAQTLVTRRTVKKDWQIAWLLRPLLAWI